MIARAQLSEITRVPLLLVDGEKCFKRYSSSRVSGHEIPELLRVAFARQNEVRPSHPNVVFAPPISRVPVPPGILSLRRRRGRVETAGNSTTALDRIFESPGETGGNRSSTFNLPIEFA